MAQFIDTFAPLRQSLANLAQQRKEAPVREMQLMQLKQMKEQQKKEQEQEKGLKDYMNQNPGMDPDRAYMEYFANEDIDKSWEMINRVTKQAEYIRKTVGGQASVDFFNTKFGTDHPFTGDDEEPIIVPGSSRVFDKKTKKVILEPVKPEETDAEKRQAEFKIKKDLMAYEAELDSKYKDTPEGIQAKKIALEKYKAGLEKPKEVITWTTAINNLSKRFGSQNAMGSIIITKGLENKHRLAQGKLIELEKSGMDPMEAVQKAEQYAIHVEQRYWQYIDAAKTENEKEKVNSLFEKDYGYIPKTR